MNNYQDVFKRYEKKYLINEQQYNELMEMIEGKMIVDQYGESLICNIYFDTPNYQLIRQSIEKPIYKEKLRMRSYGIPKDSDNVFVELKKKYDGIVFKRRVAMPLLEAEKYLYKNISLKQHNQITNEIDWFKQFYRELKPAMYISYDRIALFGNDDKAIRITFDRNINWRTTNLNLQKGIIGNPLLEKTERLMEIKVPGAIPLWLTNCFNKLEIYSTSFSKYGNAYKEMCNKTKGVIFCA